MLPSVMSLNEPVPTTGPYSRGLSQPTGFCSFWFISATRPAHSGATALVPPTTNCSPSTRPPGLADGGTPASFWYAGRSKTSLTPPPPALRCGSSFHTTSLAIAPLFALRRVPPQHSTYGL